MSGKGDRFFFFTLGVCCVEVSRNEKNSLFFFFSLKKKKKLENRRFPHLGCELMEFPKGGKHLEPPQWDRGPAFSSFESGYIAGAFSERELEEKERRR